MVMSTMAKTAVTWPQRIFVADIGWPSNGSTQLEGFLRGRFVDRRKSFLEVGILASGYWGAPAAPVTMRGGSF
jgi:hypothetical protein